MIEDTIDRHAINPAIAPRFRGKDLPRLKQVATQFFCAGSGGPQRHEGRDLPTAHGGLNIDETEFVAAVDDVVATLNAHGTGASEVGEVVAILHSLKGEVLQR